MSNYTAEIVHKIWDDKHGDHIEVGPDGDGIDHIEIKYVTAEGKIGPRFSGPPEQMRLVAEAILKLTST